MSSSFYVYTHRKPNGEVFYVGKGSGDRYKSKKDRSQHWHRVVKKHGYTARIELENLTEKDALSKEIELISYYGMENLCNHTKGGEGISGYKHTKQAKNKMSNLRVGKKHSEETRKKMSEWHKKNSKPPFKGKKLSEKHKKLVGDGVRGRSNGRYNHSKHYFIHPEHGVYISTQRELINKYGLHHGAVSGMVSGKVKSVKGWKIERRAD